MSVLTTTPLKVAPSAAAGVTLATGTAWAYGAWVEVIAATAAPIAIAGVALSGGTYSGILWEVEIGVGAASAEVPVGMMRFYLQASANFGPAGVLLPVPLGGIGAGVRVAVRSRNAGGNSPATLALQYYENLSSDQVTTSSQVLSAAPSGSGTATLTPSGTAWANSAWVELIPSAATAIGLLGLVHAITTVTPPVDGIEYDLGTGGAGAETVITTLRQAAAIGKTPHTWLPGIYPVAAGTRVAVRMRKAGTNTGALPVALLYYTNVSGAAAAVATATPFVWGPL